MANLTNELLFLMIHQCVMIHHVVDEMIILSDILLPFLPEVLTHVDYYTFFDFFFHYISICKYMCVYIPIDRYVFMYKYIHTLNNHLGINNSSLYHS